MRPALLLLALTLLAGCERRSLARPEPPATADAAPGPDAAAPTPQAPAVVPRGCDINLAGTYHLASSPTVRYRLDDDGEHVTLRPEDSDAGGAAMALAANRTPQGLVGLVTGQARAPGGALCAVSFRAEIVACRLDGLTLRSEDTATLDDACQVRGVPGAATEKILVRE